MSEVSGYPHHESPPPVLASVVPEYAPMPATGREIVAVLALVVAADLTLYRGYGLAGAATFFLAAPLLLVFGSPRLRKPSSLGLVGAMILLLAARMAWCGFAYHVPIGLVLVVAFAMSLAGQRPYILDLVAFIVQTIPAGFKGWLHYCRSAREIRSLSSVVGILGVLLPLAALLVFGILFVEANPDLARSVGESLRSLFENLGHWLGRLALRVPEVLFWIAVAWIAMGLLRPILTQAIVSKSTDGKEIVGSAASPAILFGPLLNTMVAVNALFAVYLVFEFKTLWFKDFPKGFYYAGYAHEGAAWLTAALALATATLSAIFRGPVLRDPRLPRLKRLAWIWSAENVLLALAVYNRLLIYIHFNGMTRMRMVAIYGITTVLVGFVLVVWKIVRGRSFIWLVHGHLGTLALAIYVLAITPVDPLVHGYNVRRILAGDLAPSVQIITHPVSSEGILMLHPLVNCEDAKIREGIRALLANWALKLESDNARRERENWTSYQAADQVLSGRLREVRGDWEMYTDGARRSAALQEFYDYSYQWY